MAISTNELNVPQIGGGGVDTSWLNTIQKPQQTSLSDLLSVGLKSLELRKARETYDSDVAGKKAVNSKAVTESDYARLKNLRNHLSVVGQSQLSLIGKQDLNADDIKKMTMFHAKNYGTPPQAVEESLSDLPENGSPAEYRAWLGRHAAQNLSKQAQLEKYFPNPVAQDTGGNITYTNPGHSVFVGEESGAPTGAYYNKTLSPQVVTNQITGAPYQMGGTGAPQPGNLNNRAGQVTTSFDDNAKNTLSKNNAQATTAKANFSNEERQALSGLYSTYGKAGVADPSAYIQGLQKLKDQFPDSKNMANYVDSAVSTLNIHGPNENPNLAATALQTASQLNKTSSGNQGIGTTGGRNGGINGGGNRTSSNPMPSNPTQIDSATGNPIGKITVGDMARGNLNQQIENQFPLGKIEPMRQGANESPVNFNARMAGVQQSYQQAKSQLSDPNSERGYIPQIQQVGKNILGLLKDPDVKTGAVNSYLAGKTNKGSLTSKEQELAKYLEQRMQIRAPKSDADAESKRNAYGSFNLDKDALKDLTRQDLAWTTTQDLAARGRLNNGLVGGTANNPNYGRIEAFNNKFAQLSRDPDLMQYVAIVGDNPNKIRVDEDDRAFLQKFMANKTPEQRQKLELGRKTLLGIVGDK
jgi:hypothetical protein